MSQSRQYELVYLVSPNAGEQDLADLHAQVEAVIGRFGGQLVRTESWGRRKLAYEIAGHKEATYVLDVIDGSGDLLKEIDRRLKVSEQVLRHLVVRVDEALQAAERLKARRQADAERRTARLAASGRLPAAPAASEATPAASEAAPEASEATPAAAEASPAAGPAEQAPTGEPGQEA